MQVIFSFDDTGSMGTVRKIVRNSIKECLDNLYNAVPNLEIGIIIHNDYCDKDPIYTFDFTSDKNLLEKYINTSTSNGGGDADENYEQVLNYAHTKFSWKEDSEKYLILIGDCAPHEVGYRYRSYINHLDYKQETFKCIEKGIKILPIQCLNRTAYSYFYNFLEQHGGMNMKLELSQFSHIPQFLTAFVYNQAGKLEEYENSDSSFKQNFSLKSMFNKLKGVKDITVPLTSTTRLSSLDSRFQVMTLPNRMVVIKDFVEGNGIKFKKGRGFYQFTKSETVQADKEVILVNKRTGEIIYDITTCRNMIKVPYGVKGNISPRNLSIVNEWDIYIQSNSFNRKLMPNTKFLYEMDLK